MNELLENVKSLINKASGTCIAVNSKIIDSDNIVAMNNESLYIHFSRRFKDLDVSLSSINDIKFDIVGYMTIAILYLVSGKVISIHCLH
jgi:hypothetical protein